ncbi:hypothetical protein ACIBKY_38505 [Nonomuraea sp. NPDC050394]|uniref:hypothetical protein n=1 Tax=Nonomuraea sp. NPDC050394 TaxID=3364363 RepID=UPI00378BBFCC
MTDLHIPEDLLALKRDFLTADTRCHEIADSLPSAVAVLALKANAEPERQADLVEARSDRPRIVGEISRHPWWAGCENRTQASLAVLEAAKTALATPAE